jgi:hypothetical protein
MLAITADGGATWFKPGEQLRGAVKWRLEEEAAALEIRLFWFTTGKGTRDVGIVANRRIERPEIAGTMAFEFRVPRGPYSFSGRLITLGWAIEAVALPMGETARLDLVVGPRPVEVAIG